MDTREKLSAAADEISYSATIRRTRYGVPHITAQDLAGAWFGQGYAMAEDRLCVLLDQVIKVRGERARYFGPGEYEANVESDFAYRHLRLLADAEKRLPGLPNEIQSMLTAHAAGINRYLAVTDTAKLPAACRDPRQHVTVSAADLLAIATDFSIFLSSRFLTPFISNAQPPQAAGTPVTAPAAPAADAERPGSNGWAIGADMTESGHGMLLAQPHFPWEGALQAWESHVTVPGQLDVYGITVPGVPNTLVGFNAAVAWTLTVTTSPKATLYQLNLLPGDATRYYYDGQVRALEPTEYTIEVLSKAGTLESKTRKLWRSHYGPILSIPAALTGGMADYAWNAQHVLTYRDANIDNDSMLAQFFDMAKAVNMDGLIDAHRRWAGSVPFSNTVAASAEGKAWYADSSPVPHLSPATLQAWRQARLSDPGVAALFAFHGIYLLDGSTSRDEWVNDPAARKPGLVPFERAPQLARRDFVFNANDSHWLTNPKQPLEGFYALYGDERQPPSLRTRMNARTLSGQTGKFTLQAVKDAALSNQALAGQLFRSALVERCRKTKAVKVDGKTVDLAEACRVLANWDERFDPDSRGAVLFREFLSGFRPEAGGHEDTLMAANRQIFAQAFDPAEPLATPSGLAPAPKSAPDPALLALAKAAQRLKQAGIELDARLGDVQFSPKNAVKIPIHGGQGQEGILNMAAYSGSNDSLLPTTPRGKVLNPATGLTDQGYVVNYGTSFLLAVELTAQGPSAQAVMAFSQSADPESPHYADQTALFSSKGWRPCLFRNAEIEADPALRRYQVGNR
ncbi:penicillin acylase family protein [Methylomonas koyamae]|uniref:penicillin acylase family protein n=1 Tax=Methylomonas koyamae TaxID=702114 RepID=UPI00164276A4|nr:penicillin acylase family protein [Methylomonas koyamae]